jgi:hypothetical protein
LLVIRLEDLNRVFEEAVDRFAGLSGTRIAVKNRGEEKDYKEMYFRFRQHAVIPPDYLETQYSSKYARHFYSPEEIEQFRRKWSQPA